MMDEQSQTPAQPALVELLQISILGQATGGQLLPQIRANHQLQMNQQMLRAAVLALIAAGMDFMRQVEANPQPSIIVPAPGLLRN
jgi:hypothetical protein